MAFLVTAVALFGTAVGLRFSVYVLIPAGLAVLIVSVVAQLISNKMAGSGAKGTISLLVLLNAGFAFGLFLRAIWSTKRIARLFARPGNLDRQVRRPDGTGGKAISEGSGPTTKITPRDLAKESLRR